MKTRTQEREGINIGLFNSIGDETRRSKGERETKDHLEKVRLER